MLSYRSKILIDRVLGNILVIGVNIITRIVGKILRRKHVLPENPKSIAIAKYIGLGSMIYTGVLCRTFKERFPDAKLIYISTKGASELIKRFNYVDEILYINDKNIFTLAQSSLVLMLKLWIIRPTLFFDMEIYSSGAALIATSSLALNRYGFYRKSASFKKGIHSHMVFFNTYQHILKIYNQMALCIGVEEDYDLSNILTLTEDDNKKMFSTLERMQLPDKRFALININASDLLKERCWPLDKWIIYIEKLTEAYPDINFMLTGANSEKKYVAKAYDGLSEKAKEKVSNVAGLFELGPFLALIAKSLFMVSNDSGPFHFAEALQTPTVSLWGPCRPAHYGPIDKLKHKVVYKPVYCSPCLHHADFPPCNGDNRCMQQIAVNEVLDATEEVMNNCFEQTKEMGNL